MDASDWLEDEALGAPYPHYRVFANYTLAPTDDTRESGALAVVPGSHRKGRGPDYGKIAKQAIANSS